MSDQPVSRSPSRAEYYRQSLDDIEHRRNAANRRSLWFTTPFFGLGSYVLFTVLVEALRSGIVSHPKSRLVSVLVDVSVEPMYYWVVVLLVALGAFLFLAIALGGLWILFRNRNANVASTARGSISDSSSKKP